MLKAGIVGLPNVGKSTLFNAVTRTRKAEAANYPFCTIDPNIGVVNVPIIHYSVEWWNSLHQGATVTKFDSPSISMDMLWPLLVNALGFTFYYCAMQCMRMRALVLSRERDARWIREAVA